MAEFAEMLHAAELSLPFGPELLYFSTGKSFGTESLGLKTILDSFYDLLWLLLVFRYDCVFRILDLTHCLLLNCFKTSIRVLLFEMRTFAPLFLNYKARVTDGGQSTNVLYHLRSHIKNYCADEFIRKQFI